MKPLVAGLVLLALVSCGDDKEDSSETSPIAVTLTASSINGLPGDLAAGVVDVTVTDQASAGGEINFTRVEPGTDEQAFVAGLLPVFDGGPFPDFCSARLEWPTPARSRSTRASTSRGST